MRRVDDVKEPVLVLVLGVQVGQNGRDGGQGGGVDQQEEGLIWVQLKPPADDVDQFADGDVIRDQEFALVQKRKLLLAGITLDNNRNLVRMLLPDLLHVLHPQRCNNGRNSLNTCR